MILGESFGQQPTEFTQAQRRLGGRIRHIGYVPAFADYARWLWQADLMPVTSHHDFFGASVVEGICAGCRPLLPRRLSYPELIPAQYHDAYLYTDFDELVDRLQAAIEDDVPFDPAPLRSAVSRFDWRTLAPVYDRRLERLRG